MLVSDHEGLLPINSIAIIVGEVQFPCSSKSWFVVGKAECKAQLGYPNVNGRIILKFI
jgi:hypothetical protein